MMGVHALAQVTPEVLGVLLLRATVVLAGAWLLTTGCTRASAATRHTIWGLAFLVLLLLPIVRAMGSALPVSVEVPAPPGWSKAKLSGGLGLSRVGRAKSTLPERVSGAVGGPGDPRHTPAAVPWSHGPVAGGSRRGASIERATCAACPDGRALAVGVGALGLLWVVGTCAMLARLGMGFRRARGITRRARPASAQMMAAADPSGASARGVAFLVSAEITIPVTWGLLRPVVLFPEAAYRWGANRLRYVVLHEVAHVRGGHLLQHALAELVRAVYWVNPLVWIATRRAREELERACDDRVLGSGVGARTYARELLDIARGARGTPLAGAVGLYAARRTLLGRRVHAILSTKQNRRGSSPGVLVPSVAVLGAVGLAAALVGVGAGVEQGRADGSDQDVEDLLEVLAESTGPAALRAAWALGDRESALGVEGLVEALDDRDPHLRGMAAWALGEIKDPRALAPLTARLSDPDGRVREMVAMAAGELEDRSSIPSLSLLLSDDLPPVRSAAAWALGEVGGREAERALAETLAEDAAAEVRVAAAESLGPAASPRAKEALRRALSDSDARVRSAALGSLVGQAAEPDVRDRLLSVLARDDDSRVRAAAAWALGTAKSTAALDGLLGALQDPDREVRSAAVWALDEIEGRTIDRRSPP